MTEKTVRLTTAQALVKFLNQQYIEVDQQVTPFVEGVLGIFGHGNVLGLGEALATDPGHLKVYQGHNEQGMTSTAIGFAREKLRHKIYAVTASAGPGSANFVTALGNAYANGIPVLALPADTFASRQPDPVLQQIEVDSSAATTTNDALKPVSKYWDRIQRPEQLMSALLKAFEVLTDPLQAGPVTICLPQDAEAEAFDYPVSFFQKRVHHVKRVAPSTQEMNDMLSLIKKSQYPVIFVGGGAKYSEAAPEIQSFSEKFNVPVVETASGKSAIPNTFANNLGGVGILGTSAANKAVMQSDLIIGAGSRYTDFTTSSKTGFDPNQTAIININLNRLQAIKFDALPVFADIKATFAQLNQQLTDYRSHFNQLAELKQEWNEERQRLAQVDYDAPNFTPEIDDSFGKDHLDDYVQALGTKLSQPEAVIAVNDHVAKDAIMVAAAGSLPGDVHRLWNTSTANTYHLEYGYSMMGYEIAAALGAKRAKPDQEVYALVGDGSFLMLHTELVTALQYGQKINVILFDNSGYGCINNLQLGHGGRSFMTEQLTSQGQIMNIDYAKVAEGYGAKTYRATTIPELLQALADAQQQTTSTLIDIKVLPKTMTHDYDNAWWHVGDPEVSVLPTVQESYQDTQEHLKQAFLY